MTGCRICRKTLDLDTSDEITHDVCWNVFMERVMTNMCSRCGKNQCTESSVLLCGECSLSSPYMDYPGPQ